LRAVISLCQLLEQQDRDEDGKGALAQIYNTFDEGFGTPDLQRAKALLKI